MDVALFSVILFGGAIFAGFLGALTGLGGGVVVIPLLTLGFGVDMRYAIGAALVTSIASSSGAAAAYIKEGITNVRIGMFLEIATTTGAVIGAFVAMYLDKKYIALIFGCVLIFSAIRSVRKNNDNCDYSLPGDKLGEKLKLNGSYPTKEGIVKYNVHNVAGGYSLMTLAGVLSGLLGIGSGALKVLAMDTAMKIPFKVSTTTSNFMVGVTAAASAVIYLQRGYIDPGLAFPIVVGVLLGAFIGSKILPKANVRNLRLLFSVVIFFLALSMMYNGLTGKL
ncbi:putative membrane protein YfcA [Dysgonomonas sp. PH5-45]|uniref:sulfite exporter TauE/SafE family protein n=1 Tax=unclassified Dysgonomonas TaxID=2630389 RepID=UPI002475277C|nr:MULTISPECIES: sulfite exporter TauE/SafE family protein [unclassified Dysgonomonas]MDH6353994.1 putative membrane protein YfcA [Dysgonomonas sp. PH5-45]MDH6386896.1 putative membrane protein YfcA [Dysgonomonas sp. PH5-37]